MTENQTDLHTTKEKQEKGQGLANARSAGIFKGL